MTAKRSTSGNKGGGSSTQSKGRNSSSRRNQGSSKGSGNYSRGNSSSKGGNNYANDDASRGTPSKGSSRGDNYNSNSSSKGGRSYTNDDYGSSSSKGGSTRGDGYNRNSSSKGSDLYSNDNYDSSSSSKGGSTAYDNDYNRGSSTKEGNNYSNDDFGNSSSSKGGNEYSNDNYSNDSFNENASYGDSNYTKDNYGSDEGDNTTSKGRDRYREDEPINDPPYDENNEEIVSKQPNTNRERNSSKNGDDNEADMVFTEEEVYGDDSEENTQNTSGGTIERVWLWAGGAVPRTAIRNAQATWWTNRVSFGMTDYVISLNDHDFSNGLGIKSNYVNRGERSNRWAPICEILRICDSHGIAPHLMIFLKPIPEMIRDAANVLAEIVADSQVVPRSIQLDLEGWWTRRPSAQRAAGNAAIQQYFKDEWEAPRPELGIGVTCIGSTPPAVHGALEKVDFAIPQMYASERNYGRPIRENSVRSHFSRAAEALGNSGKVIGGQTAYSRYVNPEIMKEMLSVLLRLNHSNVGGVSEVAFWSDTHLRNSRANREFFQRLTSLVRQEGLNLNNIDNL